MIQGGKPLCHHLAVSRPDVLSMPKIWKTARNQLQIV
jgi:hypothetical protein